MIALALAQAALVLAVAWLLARRRSHLVPIAAILTLLFIAWAMATSPARYAPYFYAHGGLLRTIQVLAMRAGGAGVVLLTLSIAALYLARTRARSMLARADILLLTATTWPDGNAYPRSYEGLDHARVAAHFRDLGYDVRTVAIPRTERSHDPALLFLPIVDTPLARVLAPAVERSAHAGEPAFVAREAKRVLASAHDRPLFLDVRFDATDPPYDVPPAREPVNDADDSQLRAAAADVEAAVRELTPLATTVFTADHGRTPFAPVPVRGEGAEWLELQTGPEFVTRGPPEPSTGLPTYLARDGMYRPKRTGAEYTGRREALQARFREDGLVEQEGYWLPPPKRPYRVELLDHAPSNAVVFPNALGNVDLHDVIELTKTGAEPIQVDLGPPLAIAVPGVAARVVEAPVGAADLAPTLRELTGLESHGGVSLVPLLRGQPMEPRAILTRDADGTRTLTFGDRRLVVRRGQSPSGDPEMVARFVAAEAGVPMAGTRAALEPPPRATLHLRFAGAGAVHRISGTIEAPVVGAEPIGIARDAYKIGTNRIEIALTTMPNEIVGLDVVIEPPSAAPRWQLSLDDGPWPVTGVFLGCHGLATRLGASGLPTEELRLRATCAEIPALDPRADLGMLVTR